MNANVITMVVKRGSFIYNYLSEEEADMNNKKNRKIISAIIVIILVLAMVVPLLFSAIAI